jgi:hypothetical protein
MKLVLVNWKILMWLFSSLTEKQSLQFVLLEMWKFYAVLLEMWKVIGNIEETLRSYGIYS